MHEMADLYPDLIKIAEIGHSAEGREMFALQISADRKARSEQRRSNQVKAKQGIVITGAQHAREVRPMSACVTWVLLYHLTSFG